LGNEEMISLTTYAKLLITCSLGQRKKCNYRPCISLEIATLTLRGKVLSRKLVATGNNAE